MPKSQTYWGVWLGSIQRWLRLSSTEIYYVPSRAVAEAMLRQGDFASDEKAEVRAFMDDDKSDTQ